MSGLRRSSGLTNLVADTLRFRDLSGGILTLSDRGVVRNDASPAFQNLMVSGQSQLHNTTVFGTLTANSVNALNSVTLFDRGSAGVLTYSDVSGLLLNSLSVAGSGGPTAGATGASGEVGLTGATGLGGPIGLTGSTGASGDIGATGPIGLTGSTGASGDIGATGPAGELGPIDVSSATIGDLYTSSAFIVYIDASSATIGTMDASSATIDQLTVSYATIGQINAVSENLDQLTVNNTLQCTKLVVGTSGELVWNNSLQLNNHPIVYNLMATTMPYIQLNSSLTEVINAYNLILQNLLLAPTMDPPPPRHDIYFYSPCGIILNVEDPLGNITSTTIKLPVFIPPYIIEINDLIELINAKIQNANMPIYFLFDPNTLVVTLKIPPNYSFYYTDNTNVGEGQRFMNHLGLNSVKNYFFNYYQGLPDTTFIKHTSDQLGTIPTSFPSLLPSPPVIVGGSGGTITIPSGVLAMGYYVNDLSDSYAYINQAGPTNNLSLNSLPRSNRFFNSNGMYILETPLSYTKYAYTYITEFDETTLTQAFDR
jgi:hypothetical protein